MARDGAPFAAQKRDEATYATCERRCWQPPGTRETHPHLPTHLRTRARPHASQRSKNPNRDPPPRAPQNRIFSGKMRRSRTRAFRQTYNRATVVHGAFWHVRNRVGAREDAARNQARNRAAQPGDATRRRHTRKARPREGAQGANIASGASRPKTGRTPSCAALAHDGGE